jgi:hypothetical protein
MASRFGAIWQLLTESAVARTSAQRQFEELVYYYFLSQQWQLDISDGGTIKFIGIRVRQQGVGPHRS